jgi:hypothetical protein
MESVCTNKFWHTKKTDIRIAQILICLLRLNSRRLSCPEHGDVRRRYEKR